MKVLSVCLSQNDMVTPHSIVARFVVLRHQHEGSNASDGKLKSLGSYLGRSIGFDGATILSRPVCP